MINGETNLPNNKPNLNQSLLKGDKIFELTIPKIKKIKETTRDQTLISPLFNKGYKDIKRKTIEKTIPKFRFEPTLMSFILLYFIYFFLINHNFIRPIKDFRIRFKLTELSPLTLFIKIEFISHIL